MDDLMQWTDEQLDDAAERANNAISVARHVNHHTMDAVQAARIEQNKRYAESALSAIRMEINRRIAFGSPENPFLVRKDVR